MPENDFEKQVQQLFDELRLKPSVEVWPKVSSRIRKEKGRRKVLVWLPLTLLLLCAGSGYWFLQSSNEDTAPGGSKPVPVQVNNKGNNTNDNNADVQALLNSNDRSASGNEQNTGTARSSSAGKAIPDAGLNAQGSGSDSHASNGPQHSVKPPVNDQASRNKEQGSPLAQLPVSGHAGKPAPVAGKKSTTTYPVPQNNQKERDLTASKEALSSRNRNSGTTPILAARQSVDTKVSSLPGSIETEKMLNGIPNKSVPGTISAATAGNINAPIKLTKKKAWEWGITGGAGVSLITDGLSGLWGKGSTEKSPANAMPNSPNMSGNIGFLTGQNSLVAALPPPASTVKKGLAWQAGGFIKWKMNQRLTLTGGLQYSYYSTRRTVGNDINSYNFVLNNTLNDVNARYAGYYIGGQNINYTNRYHFVELPAGVQWQLNKSAARLPLQLNGGLSVSYLANTTAVHYHEQTGSYYKDRSLFNKVQAGIYAGASAKLFAGSRRPLYAGPVVRYDLTNLLKSSVNLDQHFIYAGIKAEWVLGKK